jgi:hypothetical protein
LPVAKDSKGCSEPQAKQVEYGGRVIADEILACTPILLILEADRIVARNRIEIPPSLEKYTQEPV